MAEIHSSIKVNAGVPLDKKYGPYLSLEDAHESIKIEQRYKGLVFGVYSDINNIVESKIIEYYYTGDLTNNSVKLKYNIIVSESEPENPNINDIWVQIQP